MAVVCQSENNVRKGLSFEMARSSRSYAITMHLLKGCRSAKEQKWSCFDNSHSQVGVICEQPISGCFRQVEDNSSCNVSSNSQMFAVENGKMKVFSPQLKLRLGQILTNHRPV